MNNGFAGNSKGCSIDAFTISGGVYYAAHIKGGKWLPTAKGYNINDSNNGYAGINGKEKDVIIIKWRTYSTSYNPKK